MTSTISNFQPTRRPSSSSMTLMASSCSPPSLGFSSVLYSPTMKEDPSDEILNGDKRSAHNALERQRREGLNNKFQQLAHALPGLQNIRRPSKSMVVTKSLEFVSKSVQRDASYQNKIKQLRKEYHTLRKHALQQQQLKNEKSIPAPLPLLTSNNNKNKKRAHPHQPTSPLKRQQQKQPTTSPSPPSSVNNSKKPNSPIRHKFVHHHASASSSPPEKKSQPQPQPQTQIQQAQQAQQTTAVSTHHHHHHQHTTPPVFHEFAIQPSWPPLDLSGAFMDHYPSSSLLLQQQQAIPFFSNNDLQPSFYPNTDPSYAYFWK